MAEQSDNRDISEAVTPTPGPIPIPASANNSAEAAVPNQVSASSLAESPSSSSPSKSLEVIQGDANSLRNFIHGDLGGASGGESPATCPKKKKKKKRPKSALTPSSSGSGISDPSTSAAQSGAEAHITESMSALSVSGATPAAGTTESKATKKKNKKKKAKQVSEDSAPVADSPEVEMKEVGETDGAAEQQTTETPPQGADSAPTNLQRLTQHLLNKPSRRMPQMPRQPPMPYPGQMPQQQWMPHPCGQQQPRPGQQQEGKRHHQTQKHQHQHHQHQHHQHQHQHHQHQHHQKGNSASQKNHQKKSMFQPYWSREEVSEGLKRGTLIQGPIRINPKNYEDAYVPLPDGTADVYISGMADRNRALNGDEVAVLVGDRDSWRVFMEEVNDYEKINSPCRPEGAPEATGETAEAVKKTEEQSGTAKKETEASKEGEASPDVLVEEEEEMELDSSGRPIAGTIVTNAVTGSAATPSQATPASLTPTSCRQEGGKGARCKDNKRGGDSKGQQGSNCRAKRFTSVREMLDQCSSPVVRRLFDPSPGGEEGGEKKQGGQVNADKFMQRTGKVVYIIEKKHSRAGSGTLRPMQDANHNFAVFAPNDSRVPRIMIPTAELPRGFKERPEDFARILFIARILDWCESSKMPRGTLAKSLGEAGQVEPETEALLLENNIDSSDFSDEVLQCLPEETPWTIPASELEWRRDLRRECIFTIDPSTARDLDDALHCTDLGGGMYEVGVHIADVSYFVEEDTALDTVAKERATSVYLVQKVIPMLPRLLCEQLCSLNPDEDRLSFSVIWKLNEKGEILDEWFGRTVIRSCVKLSYDHAQGFIQDPEREWTREELPPISQGFSVSDIRTRVLQMDKIAKALRQARFDSGALRLDQVKLQFTLNKDSGLPNGYFVYEQRDSNKLVEEFMLLANMAVAHKIRSAYREKAVLRRHPPPQSRMINDLRDLCSSLGFPIEVNSAKDIQLSLARYTGHDELSMARLQILVALCSRPMRNAKYFCCGMLEDEMLYSHYALNVPLYTHFTSPIRRYPDILVHRTLAAALGYCDVTKRHAPRLQQIADHCNDMKTNAKQCSEKSNELYFAIFVKEAGPLEEKGMVMQVLDKSFDVFILRLGVVKRVYCEKLPLEQFSHSKQGKRAELMLFWKADDGCPRVVTQKLAIFTSVNCVLQAEPEPLKWSAFIHRPVGGDVSIVA